MVVELLRSACVKEVKMRKDATRPAQGNEWNGNIVIGLMEVDSV
jgi:hypothetical protein